MGSPVENPIVTCAWNKPGKAWRAGRHTGIDFKASRGTPIQAIADGKVVYRGRGGGWGAAYGIHVIVQHGKERVIYAHLSKLNTRNLKDRKVKEGEILGYSGATGNTFGPHLHLEARVAPYRYNVDAIDPMPLITGKTDDDAPKPVKKASKSVAKVKADETI